MGADDLNFTSSSALNMTPGSRCRATSFESLENSKMNRPPVISPAVGSRHKDYNRLKYYSKLRTSILSYSSDTGNENYINDDVDFLRPPRHVIDTKLFLLHIPFTQKSKYFSSVYNIY